MLRVAVLALIGLALCAPAADAGWKINRATAIARIVWHHPCVDRMVIRRESAESALEQGKVASVAVAWADQANCVAFLSTDWPLSWPEFCTHVLHEAGHLAQYRDPMNARDPEHSLNPASKARSSTPYMMLEVRAPTLRAARLVLKARRRAQHRIW